LADKEQQLDAVTEAAKGDEEVKTQSIPKVGVTAPTGAGRRGSTKEIDTL